MSAERVVQYPSQQQPIRPTVVFMSDIVDGWFPGIARTCQHGVCGGRLVAVPPALLPGYIGCSNCGREAAEIQRVRRRAVSPEELRAPRGRPPKTKSVQVPAKHPCMDCWVAMIGPGRKRCQACNRRYREELALPSRLIGLLALGQTVHRDTLCSVLGVSRESFRHVVQKARRAGYRITRKQHAHYRLEGNNGGSCG